MQRDWCDKGLNLNVVTGAHQAAVCFQRDEHERAGACGRTIARLRCWMDTVSLYSMLVFVQSYLLHYANHKSAGS